MERNNFFLFLILGLSFFTVSLAYLEQGKWDFTLHGNSANWHQSVIVSKSIFSGGKIVVTISCDSQPEPDDLILDVGWYLRKANCWKEYYYENEPNMLYASDIYEQLSTDGDSLTNNTSVSVTDKDTKYCDSKGFHLLQKSVQKKISLKSDIPDKVQDYFIDKESDKALKTDSNIDVGLKVKREDKPKLEAENHLSKSGSAPPPPLIVVEADGIYQFILGINASSLGLNITYTHIQIQILSDYGYLSAVDYPLLIFYSTMCVIYVLYGIAWLIVSFMRWRELLRVQYWIGAVIFLGMLEKAVFTAEYENVNNTGVSKPSLIVFAVIVSCAKRTLSRMLVIIVSFGFGIVKPRLGGVLHRVVGVGILYFILASIEGCLRALKPNFPIGRDYRAPFFATIPLALLESAICWWVFSALVRTTRALRLRRNTSKLDLYRHFTNTLAFAVVTSVVFMLWSLKFINFDVCVADWKQLWVNEAFWHVLFALILLVIMILWRPTNNDQRFYHPLLDGLERDEEEEKNLMADVSDTMKLRPINSSSSSPRETRSVEDDLKWLEENIPSALTDSTLPLIDSEEELENTKFEISKMQ